MQRKRRADPPDRPTARGALEEMHLAVGGKPEDGYDPTPGCGRMGSRCSTPRCCAATRPPTRRATPAPTSGFVGPSHNSRGGWDGWNAVRRSARRRCRDRPRPASRYPAAMAVRPVASIVDVGPAPVNLILTVLIGLVSLTRPSARLVGHLFPPACCGGGGPTLVRSRWCLRWAWSGRGGSGRRLGLRSRCVGRRSCGRHLDR